MSKYTQNEWRRSENTLETSGEDEKIHSKEDKKIHSKRVEKIYHHFLFLFLCSHDRVGVPHDLVRSGAPEGTYSRIGLGKPFSSENSIPQLTNSVVRHFNRKKAQKKNL